jgi:hypothetical protein
MISEITMPDRINETIGVLTRREVEARLLSHLLPALGKEFGDANVLKVIAEAVVTIARQQGAELSRTLGGNSLGLFRGSLIHWTKGDALAIDLIEESEKVFAFNVTRCNYAEMYNRLGIPELGPILSCSRDFALVEGFNPKIRLVRKQTLMEGAPYCDFCYRLEE